jgi:hypothetical protein
MIHGLVMQIDDFAIIGNYVDLGLVDPNYRCNNHLIYRLFCRKTMHHHEVLYEIRKRCAEIIILLDENCSSSFVCK